MSANTIEHTDSRGGLLRLTMRTDALISGLFGIVGLAGWIPEFSGTPRAFGCGVDSFFVGYGLIVWKLAALPSVWRAGLGVVVTNLLYAMAAVVVVAVQALPLNDTGVTFAVGSAVYTLVFAQLQYLGWRHIKSSR
jgi:NhaP-type Na+/H+ and K+/H+ antiporter